MYYLWPIILWVFYMSLVLYRHVLKKCTIEFLKSTCSLRDFGNPDNIGYACSNRKRYIMQNKIPPLSLAHEELRFCEIPPKLSDLKMIEERFLAPCISFIWILELFVHTQKKSKGRIVIIVNVPTNVESSLTILPRRYNDLGIIMVKLEKRVAFKSSVWQETIRVNMRLSS